METEEGVGGKHKLSQDNNNPLKRQRLDYFSTFFDTNFRTFETKIIPFTMDEYGMSIDDLKFQDIAAAEHRLSVNTAMKTIPNSVKQQLGVNNNPNEENDLLVLELDTEELDEIAELEKELLRLNYSLKNNSDAGYSKLVSTKQWIQFTCDFKIFNLSSKLNFKSMKDFILHVSPQRLLLVNGSEQDFEGFASFVGKSSSSAVGGGGAMTHHLELFTPANRKVSVFNIFTESLKLQISRQLIPSNMKRISAVGSENNQNINPSSEGGGGVGDHTAQESGSSSSSSSAAYCSVALLKGGISTLESITADGNRLIKYLGENVKLLSLEEKTKKKKAKKKIIKQENMDLEEDNEQELKDEEEEPEDEDEELLDLNAPPAPSSSMVPAPKDESVGVISFGEVTLTQLKQQLDMIGIKTEFRVGAMGGILVCNEHVIISKDSHNNHFQIEGLPTKTFFDVRRILYQQFAFV
jgi:hypothetical protein